MLTATLIALVLVGALAWWSRDGRRESAAVPQVSRQASETAKPTRLPAAVLPTPNETGGPAVPWPDSLPAAEAPDLPAEESAADQRQLSKITRGMSVAAGAGVLVEATPPGSVTGQMRLRAGDVITAVNGAPITSPEEFARIYREQGLPRQLTIVRDGREIHLH
jgi:type II secretory pathway component PulC